MAASSSPPPMPSAAPRARLFEKSVERLGGTDVPGLDDAGHGQHEHRGRRVVERRLGDQRLRDLRPQAEPVEQRDQDGGIGRGERRADQERDRERQGEDRHRDERHHDGRDQDPGEDEQPETHRRPRDDAQRDPDAAVEEDQRDAEGEHELGAEPVDRVLDQIEHRRPDEDARAQQHDHQRQAKQDRDRDRHDPGEQDQADVAKDVLRVHARRLRPTAADRDMTDAGMTGV